MTVGIDLDALDRDGWTRADLLGPDEVRGATAVVDRLGLAPDHPFFASPAQAWGPEAQAIDRRLKEIVGPRLAELVPGYRAFMAGVTSKGASDGMEIRFHQDWTYTDERTTRAIFFWCPLVATDRSNGGLAVVPRSHRWNGRIRPSRRFQPAEELQEPLRERAIDVPLAAGTAVVFDPATFHGSGPNPTPYRRPAITIAVVPQGVELLHFHEADDGTLSGHVVDADFFTTNPYQQMPVGRRSVAPYDRAITRADLEAALEREPVRR